MGKWLVSPRGAAAAALLTELQLNFRIFAAGRRAVQHTAHIWGPAEACSQRQPRATSAALSAQPTAVRRDALQHQPSRDEPRGRHTGVQATPAVCRGQALSSSQLSGACSRGGRADAFQLLCTRGYCCAGERARQGERQAAHGFCTKTGFDEL